VEFRGKNDKKSEKCNFFLKIWEMKKAERIKDYSDFLQNIIQEFHKSRV